MDHVFTTSEKLDVASTSLLPGSIPHTSNPEASAGTLTPVSFPSGPASLSARSSRPISTNTPCMEPGPAQQPPHLKHGVTRWVPVLRPRSSFRAGSWHHADNRMFPPPQTLSTEAHYSYYAATPQGYPAATYAAATNRPQATEPPLSHAPYQSEEEESRPATASSTTTGTSRAATPSRSTTSSVEPMPEAWQSARASLIRYQYGQQDTLLPATSGSRHRDSPARGGRSTQQPVGRYHSGSQATSMPIHSRASAAAELAPPTAYIQPYHSSRPTTPTTPTAAIGGLLHPSELIISQQSPYLHPQPYGTNYGSGDSGMGLYSELLSGMTSAAATPDATAVGLPASFMGQVPSHQSPPPWLAAPPVGRPPSPYHPTAGMYTSRTPRPTSPYHLLGQQGTYSIPTVDPRTWPDAGPPGYRPSTPPASMHQHDSYQPQQENPLMATGTYHLPQYISSGVLESMSSLSIAAPAAELATGTPVASSTIHPPPQFLHTHRGARQLVLSTQSTSQHLHAAPMLSTATGPTLSTTALVAAQQQQRKELLMAAGLYHVRPPAASGPAGVSRSLLPHSGVSHGGMSHRGSSPPAPEMGDSLESPESTAYTAVSQQLEALQQQASADWAQASSAMGVSGGFVWDPSGIVGRSTPFD